MIVSGSLAAMIIVGVLGVLAWIQRGEAIRNEVLAEKRAEELDASYQEVLKQQSEALATVFAFNIQRDMSESGHLDKKKQYHRFLGVLRSQEPQRIQKLLSVFLEYSSKKGVFIDESETEQDKYIFNFDKHFARFFSRKPKFVTLELKLDLLDLLLLTEPEQRQMLDELIQVALSDESPHILSSRAKAATAEEREFLLFLSDLLGATANPETAGDRLGNWVSSKLFKDFAVGNGNDSETDNYLTSYDKLETHFSYLIRVHNKADKALSDIEIANAIENAGKLARAMYVAVSSSGNDAVNVEDLLKILRSAVWHRFESPDELGTDQRNALTCHSPRQRLIAAKFLRDRKKFEKALLLYEGSKLGDAIAPQAIWGMMVTFAHLSDPDAFVGSFISLNSLWPGYLEANRNYVRGLIRTFQESSGEAATEKMLSTLSKHDEVSAVLQQKISAEMLFLAARRHTLGELKGKLSKAIEGLNREETAQLYGNLSWHLLLSGDFEGAITAADRGLDLAPGKSWIAGNKAHALLFIGREADARSIYDAYANTETPFGRWENTLYADFTKFAELGFTHTYIDAFLKQNSHLGKPPPKEDKIEEPLFLQLNCT